MRQEAPEAAGAAGTSAPSDSVRFAGRAGLFLAGTAAGRACKLGTRVAIARLLGASALGTFDLALTVVLMLTTLLRSGFALAVVRFGAPLWPLDRLALRRLVLRTLMAPVAIGSVLGIGLAILAAPIARGVFQEPALVAPLRIVSPLIALLAAVPVLAATAQAAHRMGLTALLREVVEPVLTLGLFTLFIACGFGALSAFWGALIAAAVAFLAALFVALHLTRPGADVADRGRGSPVPTQRELVAFSLPVGMTGMLMAYLLWVDRLMLGAFRSAGEVGIYGAASQLSILFALVLSSLQTVFAPMFSSLDAERERARVAGIFHTTTKWGLYLLIPVLATLLLLPESALGGVFGSQFEVGARPLQVLLLGQLMNVLTGPVGLVLTLRGRERLWFSLSALALTINVLLNLIWIPRFGMYGTAGASALAFGMLFGIGAVAVRRHLGLWPLDRRAWKLLAPAAAALVAAWVVGKIAQPASLLGFVLALASAYVSFAATRLLLPADTEDRELWRYCIQRLRGHSSNSES